MSSAIGPLTGGALIALFGVHNGWRAVFFVNLPIGAAILLLARRYLPAPTAAERRPQSLDPVGVVLLGAAILCILVPFIEQRTWHSPLRVALFPLGALLLLLWVLHERRYSRTHEPLVSLDLFRIRSYALGAPVGLLFFAGFIALFFIQTQYLQLGLGYPAWKSGLAVTPFAIGSALVSAPGSRQALRHGPKLEAFGLAAVLIGMAGVWVAVGAHPGHDVALWIALPLLIAGAGSGLVISPNLTLTLSRVPVQRAGSAGGVLQTGQRIGTAAGIAITGMRLLQPARGLARRLRVSVPLRHRQHRRVRRRRARARPGGRLHARGLSAADVATSGGDGGRAAPARELGSGRRARPR